jgi:branched-chain amino acid transport system ATP-binding protein
MSDAVLQTDALSRRFGGLAAVRDVTLALEHGKVHAVLGPNGAGKTTLINLLSGDLPVSGGRIVYKGVDVTRASADRRSRLGIGRSFQKTNIFPAFTTFENCRLAAQSRRPRPTRIFADALSDDVVCGAAKAALEATGLSARARRSAGALSHGEQRQLEIAMVLATVPDVLLLDEPLAGMGPEEAARMVALLRRLRPAHATLLVEHDMDAVFTLADVITVMVEGAVLESGPPEQIRASAAVMQAYLGSGVPAPPASAAGVRAAEEVARS